MQYFRIWTSTWLVKCLQRICTCGSCDATDSLQRDHGPISIRTILLPLATWPRGKSVHPSLVRLKITEHFSFHQMPFSVSLGTLLIPAKPKGQQLWLPAPGRQCILAVSTVPWWQRNFSLAFGLIRWPSNNNSVSINTGKVSKFVTILP